MQRDLGLIGPMSRSSKEKLKTFLVIATVVVIFGGGIFAFTWMVLNSGMGACMNPFVRCVKIIP